MLPISSILTALPLPWGAAAAPLPAALLPAAPLLLVLLSLALLPALWPKMWHHTGWRGLWLLLLASPAAWADWQAAPERLGEAAHEYVAFVVLLGSLYVVASCTALTGSWRATPGQNTALLALGASLASFLGTTGASMLLIRPLLRSNAHRHHQQHTVVFFIFLVSNVGGLLLPLGDPPLFLGFLHGVPFFWTLRLWPAWLLTCATLLGLYFVLDRHFAGRETTALATVAQAPSARPRLLGRRAFVAFAALLATMVFGPSLQLSFAVQQLLMLAIAGLTLATTAKTLLARNDFGWAPIVEVAQVFAAIFVTMPAALALLGEHHAALPLTSPTAYFWATGLASSVLDNAPCYLSFATLAAGHTGFASGDLAALAASPVASPYLQAVALGAVTMGAMTYVGNGPNLMVRSIALHMGAKAPSFFGYVGWATVTLLPVLACTQWLLYIALR